MAATTKAMRAADARNGPEDAPGPRAGARRRVPAIVRSPRRVSQAESEDCGRGDGKDAAWQGEEKPKSGSSTSLSTSSSSESINGPVVARSSPSVVAGQGGVESESKQRGSQDDVLAPVSVARSQSLTVFTNAGVSVSAKTPTRDVSNFEVGSLLPVSFPTAPVSVPVISSASAGELGEAEPDEDENEDQALRRQQRARFSRRAMSDEFSLSLLQEELGYPRRKLSRTAFQPRLSLTDRRSRGGSLVEDRASSISAEAAFQENRASLITRSSSSSNNCSAKSSASGSVEDSPSRRHSMPEPEAEEMRQFRWSMASTAYAFSGSDRNSLYEYEDQHRQDDAAATTKSRRKSSDAARRRHRQSNSDRISARQDPEEEDAEDNNEQEDCADSNGEGDEDENFMDYRVASVTGYSRDADGIVYYEVIVRSNEYGPLSAYKVRRRYSEFRDLHQALSQIMPVSTTRLSSISSMGYHHRSNDDDAASDANASGTPFVGLRFSSVETPSHFEEATLPPLPDKGGLWSYLQFDSVPLLERRAKYFHAMLMAAQQHPGARQSRLLNDFVGTPPDLVALNSSIANSYVSLHRFAAPRLSISVEVHERKQKARSIRLRRSSLGQRNSLPNIAGV
jgi:hypothetical protein